MKQQDKTKLGRRDFLRAIGAGAGVAATTAVPLASSAAASEFGRGKEEGALSGKFHRRADLLQGQPLSELREMQPC